MIYTREENVIKIREVSQFNIEHILECGQVFCYEKTKEGYIVFPGDKYAKIIAGGEGYQIITDDANYFIDWFDLDNDYNQIKNKLNTFKIMKEPIKYGYGIRILKQDLFEMLVSFIISANNNIKRIKLILNNLRTRLGENINGRHTFPSYEKLSGCSEEFFKECGAGYRASYLVKVLKQITPELLERMRSLPTKELRSWLIGLSGVGPKVADCVLLFGYNRFDVFPVDTWIVQMYNSFYSPLENREKISKNLVDEFGLLSGYAQQYLFYFQRSFIGGKS